jgi:hypothetical protein
MQQQSKDAYPDHSFGSAIRMMIFKFRQFSSIYLGRKAQVFSYKKKNNNNNNKSLPSIYIPQIICWIYIVKRDMIISTLKGFLEILLHKGHQWNKLDSESWARDMTTHSRLYIYIYIYIYIIGREMAGVETKNN